MNSAPELFGLYGFTHGWARTLTVMSPRGASAVVAAIPADKDVILHSGEGRLPLYQEKRAGALERLVITHAIAVLTRAQWDARKAELGESIYL